MKKFQKLLQQELISNSNKQNAEFMVQYFKNVLPMRGIKQPQLKSLFTKVWDLHKDNLSIDEKKQLAKQLLQQQYQEDKLVGTMIYKQIYQHIQNQDIDQIKEIIQQGKIQDWGTCDTIAGNLLRRWTTLSKENTQYLCEWRLEKECLWVRRACCVAFVVRARHGDNEPNFKGFLNLMFEVCGEVVKYNQRFNQLGCGWLMRELTIADNVRAIQFIEDNYDYFSREGLRYAIEKLPSTERLRLLNKNKNKNQQAKNEINQQDEEAIQKKKQSKKVKQIKNESDDEGQKPRKRNKKH